MPQLIISVARAGKSYNQLRAGKRTPKTQGKNGSTPSKTIFWAAAAGAAAAQKIVLGGCSAGPAQWVDSLLG